MAFENIKIQQNIQRYAFIESVSGDQTINELFSDIDQLTIHLEGTGTGQVELQIIPENMTTPRSPNSDGSAFYIAENGSAVLSKIGRCAGFVLKPTDTNATYAVNWSQTA